MGVDDTCWYPGVLMVVHRQKMLSRVNVKQIQKVKQNQKTLERKRRYRSVMWSFDVGHNRRHKRKKKQNTVERCRLWTSLREQIQNVDQQA